MKHESACIPSKINHHRALKDLSEALEQLPSSHRAILTNHDKV